MPAKRKQKIATKVTTKRVAKKISKKLIITGLIVVGLVLVGLVAAKSMMKTAQVALISTGGGVGGPVASPVCGTITQFNVLGQCSGKPTFTTATYMCTTMNGIQNVKATSPKTQTLSCVGVSSLYDLAYKTCSTTCLRPSPYPTSTAYPSPSAKPTSTPSACRSTLSSLSLSSQPGACSSTTAQYIQYKCADGYAGQLGDGTTCVTVAQYKTQAANICAAHPCTTPTPTPTPTVTSKPFPSSTSVPKVTPPPTSTTGKASPAGMRAL